METTTDAGAIEYEHGGTTWSVPVALLEIQRAWDQAEADCGRAVAAMDEDAYKEANGRRADATMALHRHPWLREQMGLGRRHQADTALKHLARSGQR